MDLESKNYFFAVWNKKKKHSLPKTKKQLKKNNNENYFEKNNLKQRNVLFKV
jgi:hypothetical protein